MASRMGKQVIADQLRQKILSGELAEGDKLPTEVELIKTYDVARMTVRDALGILINEGLIQTVRPHGTFVRTRRRMQYRPQSDLVRRTDDASRVGFLTDQEKAGRAPTQTIEVAIVRPPQDVAERLLLGPDDVAVVRRRLRSLEDEPFLTNDSYFPLDITQGTPIMHPQDIARGANQVLAEHGHVQVRATDEFTVRMPTPDEQHRLDLAPGTPVAYQLTTGYGPDDKPLRVAVTVLPGDRHVIIFERPGLTPEEDPAP
ncbi:GntR family transcriptional regulator [Myceligenerans halotolerans]